MDTIIKIIRSSIKKNPNAGRTSVMVDHGKDVSFTDLPKLPEFFKDGENIVITSRLISNFEGPDSISGIITDEETTKRAIRDNIPITIEYHREQVHFKYPEPEYLYKYEDSELECKNCLKKMKLSELQDEDFFDDSVDYFITDICPHCKTANCCEYKYESIEEVLMA